MEGIVRTRHHIQAASVVTILARIPTVPSLSTWTALQSPVTLFLLDMRCSQAILALGESGFNTLRIENLESTGNDQKAA